jgi:hypothetical protein
VNTNVVATEQYEPVLIGPTWKRGPDGKFILPRKSIGWHLLAWSAQWLQHEDGTPWRYTAEQARFALHWYAVDDHGRFIYRDGTLQRLKGWGKDPMIATFCAFEFVGPCRFGGWDSDGEPIGVTNRSAWVQIAAVSKDQTRTTMRIFPGLFTKRAIREFSIDIGREIIYADHGSRVIEAVTSSPRALEGARPSLVVRNEVQHWLKNNGGHEMAAVIDRNATKVKGGSARALSITNAFEPSEESVGQAEREAYEAMESGMSHATGVLYDSIEAPPHAPLTPEAAPAVVKAIRGDSTWLDIPRIVNAILDPRNPPSQSRRYWYNQIVAAEDAWIDPGDFDLCLANDGVPPLAYGDEIALFLDCSKSDDATALVGCRLSDGLVVTLGMWQKPPGERGKYWTAPRHAVDEAVSRAFEAYRVVAFWGDPSHAFDDESGERYWDGLFDDWHRRYGGQLQLWAEGSKGAHVKGGHAVMWDMTSPARAAQFAAAAERTATEIDEHILIQDGDPRLKTHVRNARRYPTKWGISLWKGHRESPRKVDLAVAMVGARMLRRLVLNNPKRRRTGKVW